MRKLCVVAPRLTSAIKNSLTQLHAHRTSHRFSTQHLDSPKYARRVQLCGFPEKVRRSIQEIANSKAANITSGKTLYLLDQKIAKEFSTMIMADRRANVSYVAEINSGLGYLTKELLEAGIPSINMFENVSYLIAKLNYIEKKYPGRATVRPIDFKHTWNIGYVDWRENSDKLKKYFNDVETRAWNDETAIEIIGALGDIYFIRRLMSTVIFQNTLAKYGRMVLHVAVPPSVWCHLTCSNEHYDLYRCHSILFQTLFNYELLGTLPRSAFYPNYRKPCKKQRRRLWRSKIMQNDGELMNVVRIEPKADLFKDDFTKSDIVPFYYFVHHHFKCRSNRVIPALEKWIPGCGRNLISRGWNIYTEFGELTPQEILNLFILFKSWPDFKHSGFESCMDTFLLRFDEPAVYNTHADNLGEMF